MGGQELEVGGQGLEVGGQGLEVGGQGLEVGGQGLEVEVRMLLLLGAAAHSSGRALHHQKMSEDACAQVFALRMQQPASPIASSLM